MKLQHTYVIQFVVFFVLFVSQLSHIFGEESLCDPCECEDWEKIGAIIEDGSIPDYKKVKTLSKFLYDCISKFEEYNRNDKKQIKDYIASLTHFIAHRYHSQRQKDRPKIVSKLIASLDDDGREHVDELRRHLYISLGLAGKAPPEGVFMSYLKDPQMDQQRMEVVLKAMVSSKQVPYRALPRLLELSDHPKKSVSGSDVAPPIRSTERYPIRILVCRCLRQLGIDCKKTKTKDTTMTSIQGEEIKNIKIKVQTDVDQESVVQKVKEWILSDEQEKWKAGLYTVNEIDRQDINEMFETLTNENRVDKKKLQYMKSLEKTEEK